MRCDLVAQGSGNGRSPVLTSPKKKNYRNANFPVDDEGRTYHLGTKASCAQSRSCFGQSARGRQCPAP